MDAIDFTPQALFERYDGRVRYVASWARFRHVELETLLQAGRQGVLECRHRYVESSEPPPRTPFDRAIWYYIKSRIERAARQQRPHRALDPDAAGHERSIEMMERHYSRASARSLEDRVDELLDGMTDILTHVHAAGTIELLTDTDAFVSDDSTPEDLAALRRMREQIAKAVGFLPNKERYVVDRILENATIAEIAAEMQLHERTVRGLLQSARSELKNTLADRSSEQRRVG